MDRLKRTVTVAVLAGSLTVSAVTPAAAGTTTVQASSRASVLTALVTQGVITQAQADAIRVAKKPLRKQWSAARRAALAQLVADGTITASQATRIARMGKSVRRGQLLRRLGLSGTQATKVTNALRIAKATTVTSRLNIIANLVTQGTITEAQAQAYIAALVARRA